MSWSSRRPVSIESFDLAPRKSPCRRCPAGGAARRPCSPRGVLSSGANLRRCVCRRRGGHQRGRRCHVQIRQHARLGAGPDSGTCRWPRARPHTRPGVRASRDGYFEVVSSLGTRRVPVATYEMPDVPKPSAGYFAAPGMDLVDLFLGSEGTLGVVPEVTFEVLSHRPALCLVWLPLSSEAEALELVATLRAEAEATWWSREPRGLDVAAIEHLDRRNLDLVREEGADMKHEVLVPDDTAVALLVQVEMPADAARALVPALRARRCARPSGDRVTSGPPAAQTALCAPRGGTRGD